MTVHPSITSDRVIDALHRAEENLERPGFCTACGEDADGVEPDARKYTCEACGEKAVYGAEELLIHLEV